MTAPNRPNTEQSAAAKGIALLVVAVVVGVILLARFGGTRGDTSSSAQTRQSASTSTTLPPTTTTALATGVTSKPPAALKVGVFNGTGGKVSKAAGNTKQALITGGYADANVKVGHDTDERTSSVVYYAATAQRGDAAAVAKLLGLPNTSVQPVGTAKLPDGAEGTDVVVILGTDAVSNPQVTGGAQPGGSTPSSTPGSSATSTPANG